MNTLIIIAWLISTLIGLILLLKWWKMTNDIAAIKQKIFSNEEKIPFRQQFYAYILAGETEMAKILLFQEISKSEELTQLVSGVGESSAEKCRYSLNARYKMYLNTVGMEEIDFSKMERKYAQY